MCVVSRGACLRTHARIMLVSGNARVGFYGTGKDILRCEEGLVTAKTACALRVCCVCVCVACALRASALRACALRACATSCANDCSYLMHLHVMTTCDHLHSCMRMRMRVLLVHVRVGVRVIVCVKLRLSVPGPRLSRQNTSPKVHL